jgi:hypothetical protein
MTATEKERIILRNYEAFEKQLPELLETHQGEYALLRNEQIVQFFDSAIAAQLAGNEKFSDGLFSVQRVQEMAVDLGFFSHAGYRWAR